MYERANKDDRLFVGVRIGGRCTADGILRASTCYMQKNISH